jgi:formylglycine-generating enzyme required for sulfatase activity
MKAAINLNSNSFKWLAAVVVLLLIRAARAQNIDEELVKYKALESFVNLRGGEFLMGINDRQGGVNGEHPQRRAIVSPFR